MLRILLTAALALAALPAAAQDRHTVCLAHGDLAGQIMANRQAGVPRAQFARVVRASSAQMRPTVERMVEAAWATDRSTDPEGRADLAFYFSERHYRACMEG